MADRLGIPVVELPEIIGVSKAMLFAYRKGKYPISWKAWRKLEAAEKEAGIGVQEENDKWTPEPGLIAEEPPDAAGVPVECPAGIARLEAMLETVLARLDRQQEQLDRQGSQLARLAGDIRIDNPRGKT